MIGYTQFQLTLVKKIKPTLIIDRDIENAVDPIKTFESTDSDIVFRVF